MNVKLRPVISSFALALGLAAMAGCSGPRIRTAVVNPVEPPGAWRNPLGPVAPVDEQWWENFGDPVLTRLVVTALANNPDIGMATARLRQAKEQEREARAALLPSIDGGGVETGSGTTKGPKTNTNWSGRAGVQASWEIDLFGRIRDDVRSKNNAYLESKAARDSTRLSIAATVADTYITLRSLDAQLKVTQTTLDSRAKTLALIKRRFAAGYSSLMDVRQSESDYENTAVRIPQYKQAIVQAENALSTLLGELPGDIDRGKSLFALQIPEVPGVMPSQLLVRRPDVAEAAYRLISADWSLLSARKNFLPRVNLSNFFIGESFTEGSGNAANTVWSLGASILAPIFQGGRLKAQANYAAAQRDEAAWNYRSVVLSAFQDVEDNLVAVKETTRELVIVRRERDAYASAYRLAARRYLVGYSPFLEQLTFERNLLDAELDVVDTLASRLRAYVDLYKAMGGGWSPETLRSVDVFDAVNEQAYTKDGQPKGKAERHRPGAYGPPGYPLPREGKIERKMDKAAEQAAKRAADEAGAEGEESAPLPIIP